ncbi:MAG: LamG domain-containing protein [Planctomycetes bacterium]|nr:LamG domain-containing protein [Planctomycetota bacterium]
MRCTCMIAAALTTGCTMGAGAQDSPTTYAAFRNATDTIKINGNTLLHQGDFTYEMRVWLDGEYGQIIKEWADSREDKAIALGDGRFVASGCFNDINQGDCRGTLPSLTSGTWHHVAWVRQANVATLYVDGVSQAVFGNTVAYADHADSVMAIGMIFLAQHATPSFLGKLDWIRVSSVARYGGSFVPPLESGIASDANTQLLLKFNENAGATTLTDESPNGFVCEVGVPVSPGATATSPLLGQVDCSLSITGQPVDQAVGVDTPVTFVVEVANLPECTAPATYQWQRRNPDVVDPDSPDAWFSLVDGGGYFNTRSAAMVINHPTPSQATGYRCRIAGGCGCAPKYSDTVNFSVACPADFNADGGIDGADVSAFFERWEDGC